MRACKVTLNTLGDVISNQTYLSDPLTENARLYAFNIKYVGADIFMTIHGDAVVSKQIKIFILSNSILQVKQSG